MMDLSKSRDDPEEGTMVKDITAELRAQAEAIATGNDVERIPGAADFLDSLDAIEKISSRRPQGQ